MCFQVDFGRPTRVTAVATQGREDADQWVTKYTLSYGNDLRDLIPYRVNGQIKVSIVTYVCCNTKCPFLLAFMAVVFGLVVA